MLAFFAFLGSPLGKLCGYALIGLILLATVLGVKHEWDAGQTALKQNAVIVHASKVATSVVAKADKIAAAAEPKAQTKIVTRIRTLIEKVPTYVTTTAPCIPWGAVRVHDAAILGVDPSALPLPAGATDAACSDVSPAAFVAGVVANYGTAEQNAEQLNALEADLRARAIPAAPAAHP